MMPPAWILDHLEDLECDFQVFFGVRNMYDLPAREFISKAMRMGAYTGVMAARIAAQQHREAESGSGPQRAAQSAVRPHEPTGQALTQRTTPGEFRADGGLPDVIQWN
jgi:hypothetical protein